MADITIAEARERVLAELAGADGGAAGLALGEEVTESASFYVIYYNTTEFYATRDPFVGLIGNAPFVVPKDGGPIGRLSTGEPVGDQLERLEAAAVGD